MIYRDCCLFADIYMYISMYWGEPCLLDSLNVTASLLQIFDICIKQRAYDNTAIECNKINWIWSSFQLIE